MISLHRFYLRSSIIFLIIFISSWIFGYLYMDGKRMNKKSTNIYGYFFVVLNALQGIYIFVLHCVQNENVSKTSSIAQAYQLIKISFKDPSRISQVRQTTNLVTKMLEMLTIIIDINVSIKQSKSNK